MESGRGWLASNWPTTGAFSTLLRRPGLRASSDGVLATKSERKMLASIYMLVLALCLVVTLVLESESKSSRRFGNFAAQRYDCRNC